MVCCDTVCACPLYYGPREGEGEGGGGGGGHKAYNTTNGLQMLQFDTCLAGRMI